MKCKYCGSGLSRDGTWFSIRIYETDNMLALPFCCGVCLTAWAHKKWVDGE